MDAVLEMEHGLFGRKMDRNLKKPYILKAASKADKNTRHSIIFLKFDLPENSVIYYSIT